MVTEVPDFFTIRFMNNEQRSKRWSKLRMAVFLFWAFAGSCTAAIDAKKVVAVLMVFPLQTTSSRQF